MGGKHTIEGRIIGHIYNNLTDSSTSREKRKDTKGGGFPSSDKNWSQRIPYLQEKAQY